MTMQCYINYILLLLWVDLPASGGPVTLPSPTDSICTPVAVYTLSIPTRSTSRACCTTILRAGQSDSQPIGRSAICLCVSQKVRRWGHTCIEQRINDQVHSYNLPIAMLHMAQTVARAGKAYAWFITMLETARPASPVPYHTALWHMT